MQDNLNYVEAASVLANCPDERLPVVSDLLRKAGIELPDMHGSSQHDPPHKKKQASSVVTRIDSESAAILAEIRKQTGLTMIMVASQLIKEGYKTFCDTEE